MIGQKVRFIRLVCYSKLSVLVLMIFQGRLMGLENKCLEIAPAMMDEFSNIILQQQKVIIITHY